MELFALFDGSVNATFTLPEVIDFVFPVSIIGGNGVVYTISVAVAGLEIEFPIGFVAATRSVYVPAVNGTWAFPVLLMVNWYVVAVVFATLEFP
jgi:hypothetical protein